MQINTPKEIGMLVRQRRADLRLSQAGLAALVGASRQWVQNLEAGKPGLELGLTMRALKALGIGLDARWTGAPATPGVWGTGKTGALARAPRPVEPAAPGAGEKAPLRPLPGRYASDFGISKAGARRPIHKVDLDGLVKSPSQPPRPAPPTRPAPTGASKRRRHT